MPALSRRSLLRAGCAAALAAPFHRVLERRASAAPTGGARRLLVLFSPNGTVHSHWRPQGGETDFSFASGSILEPLSPFREHLIVLDGLDFSNATNHEGGMGAMLTANGPTSIDQHIANAIGGDTRLRSLELGVQTSAWGGSVQTRMSYLDGSFVTPDDDPLNAWARLFGDLGDETLLARRQAVLALNREEISELSPRLGEAERGKLDLHLESLSSVERALSGSGTCEGIPAPDTGSVYDNDAFPDIARAQLDLAIEALVCGDTRVASVQMSHTVGPTVFSWLGVSEGHHSLSHIDDGNASGIANFVACERWFAEQMAYVVGRLAGLSDPETGTPMLDDTIVLWAKELGDGRMHTCTDVPWVIAGRGGGAFTPGRYLSLGSHPHDAVLTSICQAFGLSDTSFGAGTAGPLEVLA
ncbi:MAG: DUF1552 domain-containing protein [Alphaproteobacteria bacterium]|nr:DUF1552 domain-containing protein [Alphaproteobacteria bacterium]